MMVAADAQAGSPCMRPSADALWLRKPKQFFPLRIEPLGLA